MIDVCFIGIDVSSNVIDTLAELLTYPERARANRYRFDDDRRRSIVARAATRRLLGRYLGADPHALAIVEEEHGKPVLPSRQMEFNASHSGNLVALAFARETAVGIDVEHRRRLHDVVALAQRYFSEEELAIVRSASDPGDAFFTIWTAKEAIVKATGKGIATSDLHGFTVPFRQRQLLPVIDGWSVAAVDVPLDGYYAAVATRSGDHQITSRVITAAALL